MVDIVERLRMRPATQLEEDAADVIERLRVELEGAKADIAMLIAAEVAVENGTETAKPVDPLVSMYPTRAVCAALNRRDAEMRERMSAQKAAIEREAFDTKPVEDQRTIKAGEWKPATEAELREAVEAAIAGLARIKGGDLS